MRLIGLTGVFLLTACSAKASLDCPRLPGTHSSALAGTTATQLAAAGAHLAGGGQSAIAEVAAEVRSRHPNATNGDIVDWLVAARCPAVDRQSDDLAGRRVSLRGFAARAGAIVAAMPH